MTTSDQTHSRPIDGLIEMLVAARQEMGELRQQLESGSVIGQAQGIVMERLDLEAPCAMAYLQRVSHYCGCPLGETAADILLTRELPGITSDRLGQQVSAPDNSMLRTGVANG